MEFRYRAVDGDRPSTATDTASSQPPNPSFSFFPARPMLGCNIGPSEDHVRETIQREIEKEQIRHEIIVAETSRRRELIAEVVQEMAVEREMAIRRVAETKGMSLEEKLTMWINQRKLPNQNQNNNLCRQKCTYRDPMMYRGPYSLVTSPMMQLPQLQQMSETTGATATPVLESNKDKLIVLNRADPIGAKRKAEDTQNGLERAKRIADGVGLDREPHLLGPEKKITEEWSCTLCKVSFTIERDLKEHLQEKMHKEKEAALKAKPMSVSNTTVETRETVSSNLPCLGELGSGKQQVESNPKSKFKFWCDVCSVGAFTQTVMRDHELGKKHIAAIKQQNEPPETASTSFITAPASATAPQTKAITVHQNANVQDQKVVAKETGKKTEGENKKKKVIIRCETCNIRTYSEQVMETHRLGKKHKALLEKQQYKPLAILDTNLMTAPVRSLNADPGEKGSVDHTKGKVHCLD